MPDNCTALAEGLIRGGFPKVQMKEQKVSDMQGCCVEEN